MKLSRQCGILLHPTSLPGPYGIGSIGRAAFDFIDDLADLGAGLWQVLPLSDTGRGSSPYSARSSLASSPLLIDLDALVQDGLLTRSELQHYPHFSPYSVDYPAVQAAKQSVLDRVTENFTQRASSSMKAQYRAFVRANKGWLEDYALFKALDTHYGGIPWNTWPVELAQRQKKTLREAKNEHQDAIDATKILQFLFERQWQALREYAHSRGIRIFGDMPIFVDHHSADVWGNQPLFLLDEAGDPSAVAGAPPDQFSAKGQHWGNPLYSWRQHQKSGFSWWKQRLARALDLVDLLRLDHFRGFAAHWEIPAATQDATTGKWAKGPGKRLFDALAKEFGELPIVAEDLGEITPDVLALRDDCGFPGMKVLQFAFGAGDDNTNLPEHCEEKAVVYTGTHDNNTSLGWFLDLDANDDHAVRDHLLNYLNSDGSEIHWDLIRCACHSRARLAVIPVQDLLGFGADCRMNQPGTVGKNWGWRLVRGTLQPGIRERLRNLLHETQRLAS